ncbi:MAG: hypothetical protein ACI8RD_007135 [Bacillariaceae sp.]|jgi:hypothetical protein
MPGYKEGRKEKQTNKNKRTNTKIGRRTRQKHSMHSFNP